MEENKELTTEEITETTETEEILDLGVEYPEDEITEDEAKEDN